MIPSRLAPPSKEVVMPARENGQEDGSHVPVHGVRIWARCVGTGTPVLFLSGLGYSSWCWDPVVECLSRRWSTLVVDNRGTGRSDKPPGPYSIELLADDAAGVLEAMGTDAAHVVGHSMGGYIAMLLAIRHPQRVRSLTLLGTTSGGPGTLPVPLSTREVWQSSFGDSPELFARKTMPIAFTPGWVERHPQEFERLLARRLQHPTPAWAWAEQYAACVSYFLRGIDVGTIEAPSLVVHGTLDRIVPYYNGQRLAYLLPRAKLVTLEGRGHLPFLEDPELFCQVVEEHLGSLAARR